MLKLKDVKKTKKKALKRPSKKKKILPKKKTTAEDSRPTSEVKARYRCRVKEEREKAGIMKQVDLARQIGVRRQFIFQLEEGEIFLSSPMALILCEIFGCKMDDLYEEIN